MLSLTFPLDYCVLADMCNHTWIPECGIENATDKYKQVHKRLFIDECDMFEFNCDYKREFVVTNYSLCFGTPCLQPERRMGNYKLIADARRMVYDPTDKYGYAHTHTTVALTFPSTVRPNLPAHMLRGKRRWTPHGPPNMPHTRKTTRKITTRTTTKRSTVIIKKITFMKNGKRFVKIIKGFVTKATKADSDFLE